MVPWPGRVAPAAPPVWSTYSPDPISGESPTRPGSLWARPDVVQTPPRLPFLSSARTVTVSWLSGPAGGGFGVGFFFFPSGPPSPACSRSQREPLWGAERFAPAAQQQAGGGSFLARW